MNLHVQYVITSLSGGSSVKLKQLVRRYASRMCSTGDGRGRNYVINQDQSCVYCRTLGLGTGQSKHRFQPGPAAGASTQPRTTGGRFGAAPARAAGTQSQGCDRYDSEGAKAFREGEGLGLGLGCAGCR